MGPGSKILGVALKLLVALGVENNTHLKVLA